MNEWDGKLIAVKDPKEESDSPRKSLKHQEEPNRLSPGWHLINCDMIMIMCRVMTHIPFCS